MSGVKAKLKYLANTFEIIEKGDYVECAISKKKILLENLNYWNVELQEAYFSPEEVKQILIPNIDNWIWKEETVLNARKEVWGF